MISVIIPVYKNTEEFIKNLNHNYQFFDNCEVIVINDNPKESLKSVINNFPAIKLIENEKNLGFASSVNKGINESQNKYVMLLNSDVLLNSDSYKQALYHFENDPELFAICFAQKEKDNSIVGRNKWYFQKGMFLHQANKNLNQGINAWAEGGASIMDRKKLIELGAFDSIYNPFYWEDIDLSYRAWKRGYKIIFEPKITVEHHHESTIGKYYSKNLIQKVAYRNQFIFIWKNITDWSLLLNHLLFLPYFLVYYLVIKREKGFLLGFIKAFLKAGIILNHRHRQKKLYILSDKKILDFFSHE